MSRNILAALAVVIGAAAALAYGALFTVNQAHQALVLQFGEPKRVVSTPGLNVKLPFIQNVQYFEKRLLDLEPPRQQVILADQKRLDVDTFARYLIRDPLLFYQSVGIESVARQRLGPIVNSSLRRALGNESLSSVLSQKRAQIITAVRDDVNKEAKAFGIEVVDVRIRRADYPEQVSQAVFARMKSEREREAREARGEGSEQSQQIRADAERQRTVIVAEANKRAQTLRGEGDAVSVQTYASAFGQDPAFFAFYRSMEAYRNALGNGDTTMVLSPDSEFFRYFGNMDGTRTPSQGGPPKAP
jgi:membrane protease subunit HflC